MRKRTPCIAAMLAAAMAGLSHMAVADETPASPQTPAPSPTTGEQGQDMEQHAELEFRTLDADGNDAIDRDEWDTFIVPGFLSMWDLDGSGRVTHEDLEAFWVSRPVATRTKANEDFITTLLFRNLDKNQDQIIDMAEVIEVYGRQFDRFGGNEDGTMTPSEFEDFLKWLDFPVSP